MTPCEKVTFYFIFYFLSFYWVFIIYTVLQCDLPPLRPHCGEARDGRSEAGQLTTRPPDLHKKWQNLCRCSWCKFVCFVNTLEDSSREVQHCVLLTYCSLEFLGKQDAFYMARENELARNY